MVHGLSGPDGQHVIEHVTLENLLELEFASLLPLVTALRSKCAVAMKGPVKGFFIFYTSTL